MLMFAVIPMLKTKKKEREVMFLTEVKEVTV